MPLPLDLLPAWLVPMIVPLAVLGAIRFALWHIEGIALCGLRLRKWRARTGCGRESAAVDAIGAVASIAAFANSRLRGKIDGRASAAG